MSRVIILREDGSYEVVPDINNPGDTTVLMGYEYPGDPEALSAPLFSFIMNVNGVAKLTMLSDIEDVTPHIQYPILGQKIGVIGNNVIVSNGWLGKAIISENVVLNADEPVSLEERVLVHAGFGKLRKATGEDFTGTIMTKPGMYLATQSGNANDLVLVQPFSHPGDESALFPFGWEFVTGDMLNEDGDFIMTANEIGKVVVIYLDRNVYPTTKIRMPDGFLAADDVVNNKNFALIILDAGEWQKAHGFPFIKSLTSGDSFNGGEGSVNGSVAGGELMQFIMLNDEENNSTILVPLSMPVIYDNGIYKTANKFYYDKNNATPTLTYRAVITQSGTDDPAVSMPLTDNLNDVVFIRVATGHFKIMSNTGKLWLDSTQLIVKPYGSGFNDVIFRVEPNDNTSWDIWMYDNTGTAIDNITPTEILIFNTKHLS